MEGKLIDILLHAIRSVDFGVYHFLNGYAGHKVLDLLAAFEEEDSLLKGGLFLSLYVYLWFRNGPDQQDRRGAIVAIFAGIVLAVIVSRTISDIIPFRIRPMYEGEYLLISPTRLRLPSIWRVGVLSRAIPLPISLPWNLVWGGY